MDSEALLSLSKDMEKNCNCGCNCCSERDALQEMVSRQQEELHDLHLELEEERNASSSAINEAMSMIFRLQKEKAEIQLEAQQFERFAEEKIAHDQHQISVLEDLLYETEHAMQNLDSQMHAHKQIYDILGNIHDSLEVGFGHAEVLDAHEHSTSTPRSRININRPVEGDYSGAAKNTASHSPRLSTRHCRSFKKVDLVPPADINPSVVADAVGEEEIKKLCERIQKREAVGISRINEKSQLGLKKEMAQRLCQDISGDYKKPPLERTPSSSQAPAGSFSFVAVFKAFVDTFIAAYLIFILLLVAVVYASLLFHLRPCLKYLSELSRELNALIKS